eukprot:872114_1
MGCAAIYGTLPEGATLIPLNDPRIVAILQALQGDWIMVPIGSHKLETVKVRNTYYTMRGTYASRKLQQFEFYQDPSNINTIYCDKYCSIIKELNAQKGEVKIDLHIIDNGMNLMWRRPDSWYKNQPYYIQQQPQKIQVVQQNQQQQNVQYVDQCGRPLQVIH